MRATLEADIIVSSDADAKNILYKETDETLNKIIRDDLTLQSSGTAILAASEANYTLPMGKVVRGRVLLIKTDKSIGVKINGAAAGITVAPYGAYSGLLVMHGEFTSVSVTNNDTAVAATVRYCFVGLPTP